MDCTLKPKRCRFCKETFQPAKPLQVACCPDHAIKLAEQKRQRDERKETKARLLLIKPRSQLLKEAQAEFNGYIRERDADEPCISCGRHHQGQWHAGHYLSTGARPELRFNELNVHKQCQPCNTHLHGNLILYRVALIQKIGLDKVEWLEGPHEAAKYSRDDLLKITAEYRVKRRELIRMRKAGDAA